MTAGIFYFCSCYIDTKYIAGIIYNYNFKIQIIIDINVYYFLIWETINPAIVSTVPKIDIKVNFSLSTIADAITVITGTI